MRTLVRSSVFLSALLLTHPGCQPERVGVQPEAPPSMRRDPPSSPPFVPPMEEREEERHPPLARRVPGSMLHHDGRSLYRVESAPAAPLLCVTRSGGQLVLVSRTGTVFKLDGARFFEHAVTGTTIRDASCEPDQMIWVLTEDGVIMRLSDRLLVPLRMGHLRPQLLGLHGRGASEVWAVGLLGAALHFDGTSLSDVQTPVQASLHAAFGAAPGEVVLVGDEGTILHKVKGRLVAANKVTRNGLRDVFGLGPGSLFAVGEQGTVLYWNGGVWTQVPSGTLEDLFAVWASGPRDVWAVGAHGTVVRFDGEAFRLVPTDIAATLRDVWGSSASDVWIVGEPEAP